MLIELFNCNNIDHGQISLEPGCLNIKYAINGTGKSSIAHALEYYSSPEKLLTLTPYKYCGETPAVEDHIPRIVSSEPINKVAIFNDTYVNQYLFQPDDLLPHSFEVLIRTPSYDEQMEEIQQHIASIHLLEPDMEVQDLITLDFGLVLIVPDQLRQTGIDPAHRQQFPVPGPGGYRPVLAGANLLTVGIHCTSHQGLVELPDELLSQGLHHMIQNVVDAKNMDQNLDHIGHLHRLEGLPDFSLSEDGFHLLTGQSAAGHPGRRVSKVDHHEIVQSVKIPLFLLILQLFSQFRQLGFFCILQN